jgi:hypothetical protein
MKSRLGARRRRARTALVAAWMLAGSVVGSLPAHAADDGVTQVGADPCNSGSSNPTFYSNNHRMEVTSSGRLLALYDPHGTGVTMRWRDPGGAWRSQTTGSVSDGHFPTTNSLIDRPASIAVARDPATGAEHAWVVWSSYSFSTNKIGALFLRRLSNLDSPSGPHVGPEVQLTPSGLGHVRVDLAFESTPTGPRGVVTWLRRSGDSSYQLVTAWLSDLGETPTLVGETVHYTSSANQHTGTLTPTPGGVALVARTNKLRMFTHNALDPLTVWGGGGAGVSAAAKARPSAVALASGEILATVESNTTSHIVKVVRFNATGSTATTVLETPTGYAQPSIATNGVDAWVAMVRTGTDTVVTRRMSGGTWSGDVTEITAATGGGDFASPNLVRHTDTHLRMLVDGKRCPSSARRNAVIAYQRTL